MNDTCCQSSRFSIDAVVSVDERGQLVLPKEIRDKYGVRAGDKFVIVSFENQSSLCCITFIKTDELNGLIKEKLTPVFSSVIATGA